MLFFLLPFFGGLYYSLIENPFTLKFAGISNYVSLLQNPVFRKAGINTVAFTAISVPLNMMFSLMLALVLKKNLYLKNTLRTAFITPLVVPVASIVLIWQVIFDMRGSLNLVLTGLGYGAIDWMKTDWARLVIVIVYLWKNIGYNMVLFLAGLQNIPVEYYESADIDGAGALKKFFRITLIYLTPTTFFIFIISIINSFKVFRETYLISGAYPHDSIYMLQHYMNNMFGDLDYQKLTSAAFIMSLFIYALVLVLFKSESRINSSLL
jgi:multiple sugar transport system permease protein